MHPRVCANSRLPCGARRYGLRFILKQPLPPPFPLRAASEPPGCHWVTPPAGTWLAALATAVGAGFEGRGARVGQAAARGSAVLPQRAHTMHRAAYLASPSPHPNPPV